MSTGSPGAGGAGAGAMGPGAPAGGANAKEPGFFGRLGRVELRFTQVCLVAMTALVLTSAISRTSGRPVSWAVDLATFAFAWTVFVGADVALRNDRMVSIDLLVRRLPERVRRWITFGNAMLIIVFLAAMTVVGVVLSYTTSQRTFSGLPWLSYTWVTLAVPVGCALMIYTMTHKIRRLLTAMRAEPSC